MILMMKLDLNILSSVIKKVESDSQNLDFETKKRIDGRDNKTVRNIFLQK